MENEFVVEVVSQALKVALMLAAPMLVGALVVLILGACGAAMLDDSDAQQAPPPPAAKLPTKGWD